MTDGTIATSIELVRAEMKKEIQRLRDNDMKHLDYKISVLFWMVGIIVAVVVATLGIVISTYMREPCV